MAIQKATTKDTVICVFAKPLVAGKVKTRLMRVLGARGAAALARAFLLDTWSAVSNLKWADCVLAWAGTEDQLIELAPAPTVWPQGQGDLGQRQERVLTRALRSYRFAMALGTDVPGLPAAVLDRARQALQSGADAVFGPAEDGGFYLLGLRRVVPDLLSDLPWSRPDTMERTTKRLDRFGFTVRQVDRWFDIDRVEDLDRLRQKLFAKELIAPQTAKLLKGMEVEQH